MKKILSIVTPVFNKWNFTKSYLNDLSKLPNDHEIIIIDNGSTDETKKQLELSSEINYHRLEENAGFACGSNLGYNISNGENVLFLNNDIRVKCNHDSWTKNLIKNCSDGLVGPTFGELDGLFNFIKEDNYNDDNVLNFNIVTNLNNKKHNYYLSGWCIASSKENWNKLIINNYKGPFSEEFSPAYYEDADLSFRARQLDIKMNMTYIPVLHFKKITSKQLNTNSLYENAKKIFKEKWTKKQEQK